MRLPRICFACLLLCLGGGEGLRATDAKPVLGPGATKEQVLSAYGWPTGHSKLGAREILNYPQGKVTLENGRVQRVDFKTNIPWGPPRPRPGPPSPTSAGKVTASVGGWIVGFDQAAHESARRNVPILALFTGSDWSPGSKLFQDEVAWHPEFLSTFGDAYVFLQVDFPNRIPVALTVREQNVRLRERYGVTVYPTLLLIAATGEKMAVIDLTKPRSGENYRAHIIAAVREAHDLLGQKPLAASSAEPSLASRPVTPVAPTVVTSGLLAAGWHILTAAGTGILIGAGLLWLLWRNWSTPSPPARPASIADRISEAASGLPTYAEIITWPKDRVIAIATGLAEAGGYVTEIPPDSDDKDIVFKLPGDARTHGVICCAGGNEGVITVKRVRELFGTVTVDGLQHGWFVAPMGFAADARAYADHHKVRLIDGHSLLASLRDLPPVNISAVVTREPWSRA